MSKYYVYLLECADKTLYTGITTNLERRFKEHQAGTGSRYTRAKKAARLLYSEPHRNRSSASRREAEIKKWNRRDKLALAAKGVE
jgi:putative endonuclease